MTTIQFEFPPSWSFFSADCSCCESDLTTPGPTPARVTLRRDREHARLWHRNLNLAEERGVPYAQELYVNGRGRTFPEALEAAIRIAAAHPPIVALD